MFFTDFGVQVQRLAVAFVPMLLGIICHEVAHGYAALRYGDPTAKALGRLTLNPAPHIDPMGAAMFIMSALFSPFVIGWAKPVPVDTRWFRNPRRDMMMVSLAGPVTNMILAILFGIILKLFITFAPPQQWASSTTYDFFINMLLSGVMVNFTLAWFNLIPLPPLDGGHVVSGLLPQRLAYEYSKVQRYGFIIVLLLLATGILGSVLGPLVQGSAMLVLQILGIA